MAPRVRFTAEFYSAAIRYARIEMGHAEAVVNGIAFDPNLTNVAIIAMRVAANSHEEFALLVQPEGDKLVVATECDITDFTSNGGRRLN